MSNEIIGERIKKLREQKGITLTELAKELDIQKSALSYIENDSRSPKSDLIIKICDYFNVSADYLLGRTDSISNDPNIRFFLEQTGLSDAAFNNFIEFRNKKIHLKQSTFNHDPWGNAFVNYTKSELTSFSSNSILNSIFESHSFFELVLQIGQLMNLSHERKWYNNVTLDLIIEKKKSPGKEMIDLMVLGDEQNDLSMFRCEREFRNLISELQNELGVESTDTIDILGLANAFNDVVRYMDIDKPGSGAKMQEAYNKLKKYNLHQSKVGDSDGMDKKEE